MNADEILKRATEGALSASEQDEVAEALRGRAAGDHYTLLLALGRSMATRHRDVVESFLEETTNPMLARLALQILCKFWKETERYLPFVERAMDGLAWDDEEDVKQMAISAAGEYLRAADNPALLERLLAAVDDESADEFSRQDAYLSLARAMGKTWEELPSISRLPPLDKLVDPKVVDAARARLAEERR